MAAIGSRREKVFEQRALDHSHCSGANCDEMAVW
jgi:hypothetical protein